MTNFKIGDRVKTRSGYGTIKEVVSDPELKPLVVTMDNVVTVFSKKVKECYYHYNQIEKIC